MAESAVQASQQTTYSVRPNNQYTGCGKENAGEDWINEGCRQYETRLTNSLTVVTHYLKSDSELVDAVMDGRKTSMVKGVVIALDENGLEFTSRKFSDFLYESMIAGGAQCTFIIGGFDGLPVSIKGSNNIAKISLSKMTWTHQMARLLLLEQIYRGVEIKKGSAYHKD